MRDTTTRTDDLLSHDHASARWRVLGILAVSADAALQPIVSDVGLTPVEPR